MTRATAPPSVVLTHPGLGGAENSLLLTRSLHDEYAVMEATDLGHARAVRRRLRRESDTRPRPARVLLALTVHLAVDARTAFREIAMSGVDLGGAAHYVGTPAGLSGLIGDMGGTHVADGVSLRLAIPDSTAVLRQIVDDVLPRLAAIGVVPDPEATEVVRRHYSTTLDSLV